LLPNHIHMLICTREEETISKFVGDLISAYTRSINVKHHRIGVLFGGKTKKKPVTNQEHLLWLIRYILLNPVKARLVDKPELWEHSSLYELKTNPTYPLTDLDELLSMFHSRNEFYDFLKD
ncbi:MAG: transposase, partial [Fidelibacterota bacterium]